MIIINQAHWNVDSTSPGGFLPSVLFFFFYISFLAVHKLGCRKPIGSLRDTQFHGC